MRRGACWYLVLAIALGSVGFFARPGACAKAPKRHAVAATPVPLPAGTTVASFPKGATLVRAGKKIALVKAGTVIKAGDPITPRLCA